MEATPVARRFAAPLAALAAAAVLTACGASAPARAHTVAKPSCGQQMTAWGKRVAPAQAAYNTAMSAVHRAADAENIPAVRSALEHAGQAATRMEAAPMPGCVDTGGYYARWLDRYVAAGANARSEHGLSGIELAEQPLKGAPRLRSKLNSELDSAGYTKI